MIKKIINKIRFNIRHDQISKKYISNFLPEDPVIVEAGAHRGGDTIQMAKLWPKSTIYAFEPVPELYEKLLKRTKKYQNIHCCNYALGNESGFTSINISEGKSDASSSILQPKEHLNVHPDVLFKKEINVPMITLDRWAEENSVDKVDFLWLDLQGFEYQVLNASPVILSKVKAIYTEVSFISAYENTLLYPEFKKWLENAGFFEKELDSQNFDMGNALFIRK